MAQVRSSPKHPRLLLICGLPAAGKTTLARKLAAEIPAIRLSGDEWMAHLDVDFHDEATRAKLERVFWQLAQDLLRLGTSVILESGFWVREDRDEKRLGARALGVGVELYYLDVPSPELWRRIEQRNREQPFGSGTITREQFERALTFFDPPQPAEFALFDTPDDVPTDPSCGA